MSRINVVVANRSEWNCIKTAIEADWHIILASAAAKQNFPADEVLYTAIDPHCGMAEATACLMMQLAPVLRRNPYPVLVIGDRYEQLAVAYTARTLALPVIHLQGGELSGTIDGEIRHAITQMAALHLVSTIKASKVVKKLGGMNVFVTGCPSIDLVAHPEPADLGEVNQYGTGAVFDPAQRFDIVCFHPDTLHITESVEQTRLLWELVKQPTLWITPNIDSGSDEIGKFLRTHPKPNIRYLTHVPDRLFAHLLINARALIGNSSAFIRQAAYTGTPAAILGSRQDGRELAPNAKRTTIAELESFEFTRAPSSLMYGNGRSGKRVRHLITKYCASQEQINRLIDIDSPVRLHQI